MTSINSTLKSLITSYIATNDSPESSRIPLQEFEASKYFIKVEWDNIKSWAPKCINNIMWSIEKSHVNSLLKNEKSVTYTAAEINFFLEKNSIKLFHSLAVIFESNRTFEKTIPTDLESYLTLQKPFDIALTVLWGKIYPTLAAHGILPITEPDKIREWMSDSKNENLLNRITRLDLSNCGIKAIPHEIKFLKKLKSLHLEHNEITNICILIFLPKLKRLYLSHNLISTIPDIFGRLSDLEDLSLRNNQIKMIPAHLSQASNLICLDLSHNQITDISSSIGILDKLEELLLNHNEITTLPGSLGNLSELNTLHLNQNKLEKIPTCLFDLESLEKLCLDRNKITMVPAQISHLGRLEWLMLHNNCFTEFPSAVCKLRRLTGLSLQNNMILEIPSDVAKLKQLQSLHLENNQISILPNSVFDASTNLKFIYIDDNPLLFNFSPLSNSAHVLIAKLEAFNNYVCQSKLSAFFQLIANGRDPLVIKHAFYTLDTDDQNLIVETILKKSKDLSLQKHQIFSDIDLFYVGVKTAILEKFSRLPQDTKDYIYAAIHQLTAPITDDDHWGEHHVFDHILLLIDLMNRPN